MSTESEVILARYKAVEKEADALGRVIGVRRLKPSEQTKVAGYCSDLAGSDEIMDEETGKKVLIPQRMPLIICAAVCLIDGAHIPFPRNRAELDSIYDRLDFEGLKAASEALGRLNSAMNKEDDGLDAAKN